MAPSPSTWSSDALAVTPSENKEILLCLLDGLDERCRALGLTYLLDAGTLLGAVRHRGFIPWDDDIDVVMPRADYEALCRDFQDTDLVELMHTHARPSFPYAHAKLCLRGTYVDESLRIDPPDEYGVSLDIFPFDGAHPPGLRHHLHVASAKIARALLLLRVVVPTPRSAAWQRWLVPVVSWPLRAVPTRRFVSLRTMVATRLAPTRDHVGMFVSSVAWHHPTEVMLPPGVVSFEGRRLPAPARPDPVLRRFYGDYHRLPPEGLRTPPHPHPARWRSPEARARFLYRCPGADASTSSSGDT